MQASLSGRGNCFDYASIKSCWGTLKSESSRRRWFASRQRAQQEITEYIEIFYNRQRTQGQLDHLSAAVFMQRFYLSRIAATTRRRPRIAIDLIDSSCHESTR
ncbi:hypothetical protein BTH42_10310 [Burkholderia sp. SRS-W-2-2016]|uniref:IS3 family transposase n=1 Tax=Burkholderia sp. SRS-W-2-2016 TaxID=1926878 RepID=UPI00094B3EDD|nr:IS3 family transposase [Burkholderia sp. SRS-W-2-2016]OLL31700.1 hypothetical protein BTH42_10310 [Burkholderia sp. SRS-W-2-2016]